jgi:phospholipid/cholesterol/gamma-HCH transport system substrate-binding protein
MKREIKIGILSLAVVFLFVWGLLFLKGKNIFEKNSSFYIRYDNVEQLEVAAPVLVNGFKVGSVIKIKLDPKDYTKLIVTIDVSGKIKIPKNAIAVLGNSSLVSGKVISIKLNGFCQGDDCAKSGDFIEGKVIGMLGSILPEEDLESYLKKLKTGLVGDSLNATDAGSQLVSQTKNIVSNLSSISDNLDDLIKANSKSLNATFANLEKLTYTLKTNDQKINMIVDNINSLSKQLKNSEIDTLVGEGKVTIANLNSNLGQLKSVLNETDKTVKNIDSMLAGIEGGKGTLGKLMKDDNLYNELNTTLKHTNLLLQDLRLYPGRYFNLSLFKLKKQPYERVENDPAFEEKR